MSLTSLGGNFGMNPDVYASRYAQQNGISVQEAKEELKAKYGDPVQEQSQSPNTSGATSFIPTGDPDQDAEVYADANGISVSEAKEMLSAIYGEPEQPEETDETKSTSGNFFQNLGRTIGYLFRVHDDEATTSVDSTNSSSPEENGMTPEQMELIDKGIPLDVVKQGDDAIRKYATDNNIALEKPQENY